MKYVLTDAAVRKLRGVLAPHSGNTGAGGAATPVSPDDYPAPYTVRWSQSENNGAGAWVIWFPAEPTYKNIQNPLLMVGTIRITASGVTDANTLPLGWKVLPNTAAGGDVWLRVDVPRGAGTDDPDWTSNISATFKTADDTPPYNPTDLYTHYAIPIAKAWTDQSGAKLVRQYVTSLVKLSVNTDKEGGDGGSGGGDDGEFLHPFEVRWAPNEIHPSSQVSDAGSWVIWLPDPYQVAWDDDGSLAPGAGITLTPCATLPSGWYMIGRVRPQDSEVWVGYNSALRTYGLSRSTSGLSQPRLLVATMDTSTKAVTQFVDSALLFSGDGAVTLDDASTDYNDDDEVQIKDWDTGKPASTTTIAQDIHTPPSNASALVERDHNGVLKYKGLGTLAQLLGSTVTFSGKTILTGWNWNATTHEIEISTAVISVANGVITSWSDQPVQGISTTPISSII